MCRSGIDFINHYKIKFMTALIFLRRFSGVLLLTCSMLACRVTWVPEYNAQLEEQIAILRLDSDWYASTWDCMVNLYAKVAPGGIIIFDDYHAFDGCSRAVHDFLSKNSLPVRLSNGYSRVAYLVKKV